MAVTQTQINELYLAYFGRPGDTGGLAFYVGNPANTLASVAANFSASPESVALYGSNFGAAQINLIYQNLFSRDAEVAGQVYWSGEVAAGRLTAAGAALAIMQGAQNLDKVAVQNKMTISNAFVAQLDTPAEVAGYSGAAAITVARTFLKAVDYTNISVTAATVVLVAQVAAAVGTAITPAPAPAPAAAPAPGSSITLAVIGAENIAGTAGDDTISGTYTDGGVGTFNQVDTIAGGANGAGGDTLIINTLGAVAITPPDAIWTNVSGIEKLALITSGGAGAQTLLTGAIFNAAFASGVQLTANNGAGAIGIDMTSYTAATTIVSNSTGAGAHAITTGSGAATVTSVTTAGNQTIRGAGLTAVSATANGAGDQAIGDASGGGAALVTVTAIENTAGNQVITSTSSNAVTVNVLNNGTAGNQTVTTGGGADVIIATTWGGNNVYSTGAGNDTITLLATGAATGNTITPGTGADVINLKINAAPDVLVIGNLDSGITLATADRVTNFASNDTLKMGTAGVAGGTGTYVEASAAVADFAAALAAANVALAALDGTSSATELFAFQFDGTNGYLFNDTNGNGTADQVIVLVGVTSTMISEANIVA